MPKLPKKIKALILLSGGLDSTIAVKILLEQGIKVTGLIFKSCFFDEQMGIQAAGQLKIPYLIVDFSKQHLAMVKNPKYGYGKAINPCLDCHLLMLKKAKKIMEKGDFNFAATGEVLGERPFSQNKKSLVILVEESELNGYLLRPLSAQLLPITIPEKKDWVDRKKLLAIKGRGRHQQLQLAKKYRLTYPQPAGGCLLCEKVFGEKLKIMFKQWPDCNGDDVQLLKFGRHFWEGKSLIVLGRNQKENERLDKIYNNHKGLSLQARKDKPCRKETVVIPQNFPGPTALIRGKIVNKKTIQKTKETILKFSLKIRKEKPVFLTSDTGS